MSDFWKRKLRKYFSLLDFDSDGVISEEDWVGMAIHYAKFGNTDQQKAEHIRDRFEKIWKFLTKKAEIGDRNALTVDEFIRSLGEQRYDPDLVKLFTETGHDLYDMLDVNRDGYLQEEEYGRIVIQCGFPDQSFVKAAFKAIDVNGDGKLSVDEFMRAYIDFLFSEDEGNPGASFFGPIVD